MLKCLKDIYRHGNPMISLSLYGILGIRASACYKDVKWPFIHSSCWPEMLPSLATPSTPISLFLPVPLFTKPGISTSRPLPLLFSLLGMLFPRLLAYLALSHPLVLNLNVTPAEQHFQCTLSNSADPSTLLHFITSSGVFSGYRPSYLF